MGLSNNTRYRAVKGVGTSLVEKQSIEDLNEGENTINGLRKTKISFVPTAADLE